MWKTFIFVKLERKNVATEIKEKRKKQRKKEKEKEKRKKVTWNKF